LGAWVLENEMTMDASSTALDFVEEFNIDSNPTTSAVISEKYNTNCSILLCSWKMEAHLKKLQRPHCTDTGGL